MFILNAWINPQGSRYATSIVDNGREGIWLFSYIYYAVYYGFPSILSLLVYSFDEFDVDSGMLKRLYEGWYGSWNVIVATAFCGG